MIIANGALRVEVQGGAVTIDPETGYPEVEAGGWSSNAIKCQVVPLSLDYLMRAESDGSVMAGAEYQVLVDKGYWELSERPRRVQIACHELGLEGIEREVKSVRTLNAVEQVELVV